MLNYKGKLSLVTGASSGIGNEIAKELVRRGSRVIAVARREDLLQELQRFCGEDALEYLVADLCEPADLAKVERLIEERAVDVVINNAGRGSFGKFEQLALADELQMVELNVSAFLGITHAALSAFRKRGQGAILGVSSIAAFQPIPYLATYSATKAFEFHLYMALRAEVAGSEIIVSTLNPGPVATEFAGVARVPGTATGFDRDDARMVANSALDALAGNRAFVVPGWRSYFMALSSRLLPTWLTTPLVAKALQKPLQTL